MLGRHHHHPPICIHYTAMVLNLWSADHGPSALWPMSEGYFIFFKDMNTQTHKFWQFSKAQFSVVTKFVSGPRVSKG